MHLLNIYNSADSAPEFLPFNSLVNDKYELAAAKIQTGTVDAVIIDPSKTRIARTANYPKIWSAPTANI